MKKKAYRTLSIFLISLFTVHAFLDVRAPLLYADEKITVFSPERIESEPIEIAKPKKKPVSKWWYVLAVLLAGGVAAAAGGGGGGGGSSSGGSSGGTVDINW